MAKFGNVELLVFALKAEVLLRDGTSIWIREDDVVNYAPGTTMSSQCIPLGAAAASAFSLSFNNQEYTLTAEKLDGAKVHVYASDDMNGETWKDYGVWYVENAEISEQNPFATIGGSDALNSKFNTKWSDVVTDYPRTLLLIAQTMCAVAGVDLATTDFHNADHVVVKMPDWGENATIRDVITHIAVCAAGFARINHGGKLEIKTIGQTEQHSAGTDYYFNYVKGGRFDFNCLQYQFDTSADEDEAEYTRFAIDESIEDNATNTFQLNGNPLMTQEMANDIAQTLKEVSYEGASVEWFGGIDVLPGDELILTSLDGERHRLILNQHSAEFAGGMRASSVCDMPSVISETEYFSTGPNAFNPDGTINAGAISGLDKKVVSAEVGYFNSLTTENVNASKLLAAIINATTLKADSIASNSVETDILTAMAASIIEATVRKLNVGTLKTDALSVAMAEIIGLKVESLTASDIATDRLAAALAAFTVITAGEAEFDRATVQHLVAEALNLSFGTADEVFINNLRVAYGQMVQATIGNLVIKASDGNYYRVDVDRNGNIAATPVGVSESEINAGQTEGGRVILETNITAESLNTSNLLATYALINRIDAARIDVGELFAQRAFVAHLLTTDISSNSYIQQSIVDVATGKVEQFARLDSDGLHVGEKGKPGEVLIDSDSVDVRVGGKVFSSFGDDYVEFGNQQMRRTSDGGIAFITKEM